MKIALLGPGKTIMKAGFVNKKLLRFTKEHANLAPTAEQQAKAKKLAEDLIKQETEALQTIFARFCLIKKYPINYEHIGRVKETPYTKSFNPTYYEYWYRINTTAEAFLMSREIVKDENGDIHLRILFSKELARPGENETGNKHDFLAG